MRAELKTRPSFLRNSRACLQVAAVHRPGSLYPSTAISTGPRKTSEIRSLDPQRSTNLACATPLADINSRHEQLVRREVRSNFKLDLSLSIMVLLGQKLSKCNTNSASFTWRSSTRVEVDGARYWLSIGCGCTGRLVLLEWTLSGGSDRRVSMGFLPPVHVVHCGILDATMYMLRCFNRTAGKYRSPVAS